MIVDKRVTDDTSRKTKKRKVDYDEEDVDDEIIIDPSELEALDTSNIIPRSRRSAAIRSGLAGSGDSSYGKSSKTKSKISVEDDDEEAEF